MTTAGRLMTLALCGALLLATILAPSAGVGGDKAPVYIWRDGNGAIRFSVAPR